MKTLLKNISSAAVLGAALLASASAQADTCLISESEYIIANAAESSAGGVPNYNQHDIKGKNDCGPNSAAMLLGYWDANGYACLIPGSPYYDGTQLVINTYTEDGVASNVHEAPDRIRELVNELMEETHYTATFGTAPSLIQPIGDDIVDIAAARGAGHGWTYNEDDDIDMDNIKTHINNDRPMLMCIRSAMGGGDYTMYNGNTPMTQTGDVSWHWMTMLGYTERVEGSDFWGGCVDWLDYDEVFLRLRLGVHRGGSKNISYHMAAMDDLYTVDITPSFPPAGCVDYKDGDGDGHGANNPGIGMTPGADCDDNDSTRYPGAAEACDGKDNDCDGQTDEGVKNACGVCGPTPMEVCDGIDNDCDGQTDEVGPDDDGDGIGAVCDTDDDNDGVADVADNCPNHSNPRQADLNGDGIGNTCQCANLGRLLSVYQQMGICPTRGRRTARTMLPAYNTARRR